MQSDIEMEMISHFLNKGANLRDLINLSGLEQRTYIASMLDNQEKRYEEMKNIALMFGGG